MYNLFEVILTVSVLSLWLLFPVGIFLSVSHVDKKTDQIIRFKNLKHESGEISEEIEESDHSPFQPVPFDWHHPLIFFRAWINHE